MCEIDVTPIMNANVGLMSASVAELGENAGKLTWNCCLSFAARHPIVTDANRDDVRVHFREYGAWDDTEIDAWTDQELSAMVWQEAAASMREYEDYCGGDLAAYEKACEAGKISGRLYLTESSATIYLGV